MEPNKALPAKDLCWRCEPEQFDFTSTDDLDDLAQVIGQARAVEAFTFGLAAEHTGYNVFALGPEGIGRHTMARRFLDERAQRRPPPPDWCYVSNFKEPRAPQALSLPAGRGVRFQADMARFVDDVQHALRSAFESEEYRTRRQVLEEEFKDRQEQALGQIEADGKERDIALLRTPVGFAFAPIAGGKVVSPQAFERLSESDRKRIEADIEELQKRLHAVLRQAPAWMKELRDKLRALNDETAMFAVGYLVQSLHGQYADLPKIAAFLDEVRDDVIRNVEGIANLPEHAATEGGAVEPQNGHPLMRRYRVNLLVDHSNTAQAPVVYEDDPSYDRLRGRIEHRAEMGALLTDLHMIRAGALHRANGGYLMIDVRKVLTQPLAWEGLKQALLAGEIRIQPLAQALGLFSTVTLEPEPIPLDVKIVLVGERILYYLLSALDPEFDRLFKVAADFDEDIERKGENDLFYARLVATLAR
ncbi:MAG TPA: ATP-binding protein, partial [Kiloniellales bacterium]